MENGNGSWYLTVANREFIASKISAVDETMPANLKYGKTLGLHACQLYLSISNWDMRWFLPTPNVVIIRVPPIILVMKFAFFGDDW